MMFRLYLMAIIFCLSFYTKTSLAQNNFIEETDYVATFQLFLNGVQLYTPILYLAEQKNITVRFDYFSPLAPDVYVGVVLCDQNWNIVNEPKSSYINGATKHLVTDIQPSTTTYTEYIHCRMNLFEKMNLLRSGNYLIQIYGPRSSQIPIYENKMIVAEKIAQLNITKFSNTLNVNNEPSFKAQIDVKVNTHFNLYNLEGNFSIYTLQNCDWNTWNKIKSPALSKDNHYFIYGYSGELEFTVYPFFRYFENKSLYMKSYNMTAPILKQNRLHLFLNQERPIYATFGHDYIQYPGYSTTINNMYATDKYTSAEYAYIHFSLFSKMQEDSIYIVGGFNHFITNTNNRMKYNHEKKIYEAQLWIKQGHHQYMYVSKNHNTYKVIAHNSAGRRPIQILNAIAYFLSEQSQAPRVLGVSEGQL